MTGYIAQEACSFVGIFTTRYFDWSKNESFVSNMLASVSRPILKMLYKRFTGRDFAPHNWLTNAEFITMHRSLSGMFSKNLNRTISLKQLAASIGSNLFVSAIVLETLARSGGALEQQYHKSALIFALLCVPLLVLNRIKIMQEMVLMDGYNSRQDVAKGKG